jgi:hypothetical protein
VDTIAIQQSDRFSSLDSKSQIVVVALLDHRKASREEVRDQTAAISQMLNHTEVVITDQHDKTRRMIIDAIRQAGIFTNEMGDLDGSPELHLVEGARAYEDRLKAKVEHDILGVLRYSTMSDRFDEILETHEKTFEWIFYDQTQIRYNFVDWLKTGTGIYWISGKAGSGKSTLMRYICENPKTHLALELYAGEKSLGIASHFFWIDGVADQKSQSGLLRSLLFQILSQYSELIAVVLPWLWASKYAHARDSSYISYHREMLSLSELKHAFRILIQQKSVNMRICLFVDGLDEYQGDHGEIADLFEDVTLSANCKLCVSSRPLLVLEEDFGKSPGIRLQDLTYKDILTYVHDNLSSNKRYLALAMKEPIRAPALVREIVTKADGVFLWVRLVVQSLLDGLGNRDEISDLQGRLRLLPSDLEALYQHILSKRVDPLYQEKVSVVLQIMRESREVAPEESLTLVSMTLALYDYDTSDQLIARSLTCTKGKALITCCGLIEDRVKAWCAGLIEVTGPSNSEDIDRKVQYLHRSVKDYFDQPAVWEIISSHTSSSKFDPSMSLVRSFVIQAKGGMKRPIPSREAVPGYLGRAKLESTTIHNTVLDEVDRILCSYLRPSWLGPPEHWISPYILGESRYYGRHTFLALAVQMRWYGYVEENLRADSNLLKNKPGRPLLDYAITIDQERIKQYSADQKMIRMLFKYGALPTDHFDRPRGLTMWENVMYDTYKWCHDKEFLVNQYGIIKLFLLHGADLENISRTGNGPMPARAIIQRALKEWYTPEATEIERLLKEASID